MKVATIVSIVLLSAVSAGAAELKAPQASRVISPERAAAQEAAKERQRAIYERLQSGVAAPDEFGLQCCQILHIPAAAFSTVQGATATGDATTGYTYPSTFSGNWDFWASVALPTGAHIQFLDLYFEDTNAADDFHIDLMALHGGNNGIGGTGNPTVSTVATVESFGSGGYNYSASIADYTVNNNPAYDANGAQLILRTWFDVTDGTQKFKGVDIWWNRQLTPAPAVATFPDVPTSDFAFQFIEALVASDITGGCGGGLYCPDNFVTRRQMAIFIAKALGLYWPF
jgi:hypothetical protein